MTAQIMVLREVDPPLGLSPVAFGLLFGGAWGLIANIRGRWL
ncbi:MAG: hypothetical protein WCY92_10665 [Novosphingobium sp.]